MKKQNIMKAPGAQIEANDEQPQPIEYEELFQECKVLFKNAMLMDNPKIHIDEFEERGETA